MHASKLQTRRKLDRNSSPARFSSSHLEFLGLIWLFHHHEYKRLDPECENVAMMEGRFVALFLATLEFAPILNPRKKKEAKVEACQSHHLMQLHKEST